MSHELRTPMSGVLSMTELLLQRPELPQDVRESLEVVRTSALSMVDIVNDALDLARVEAASSRSPTSRWTCGASAKRSRSCSAHAPPSTRSSSSCAGSLARRACCAATPVAGARS
jgi:signal transduction histidine kinase